MAGIIRTVIIYGDYLENYYKNAERVKNTKMINDSCGKGNLRISGAEERWSRYRKQMTDYILQESQKGEHLLVLGAGACDDLELEDLLQQFSEIWLADINTMSLKEAVYKIQNRHPEWIQRLHTIETDFVSIGEEEYNAYEIALQQGTDVLEQWWQQYWEKNIGSMVMLRDVHKNMRQNKIQKMDCTVCLGLHSQLYMELVLRTMRLQTQISRAVYGEAIALIQIANVKMAKIFLNEIQAVTNQLILGLEYTTIYQEEMAVQERIQQQLLKYGSRGLQMMQLSRVEGALQLEQELGGCCHRQEVRLADCQYFLWPFSEEKSYFMVIFSIMCYNKKL